MKRFTKWNVAGTFAAVSVLGLATCYAAEEPPAKFARGVLIRFEGPITPMLEQYLYRKLDVARQDGAELVIVEIDSPGGYLESSYNIAQRLQDLPRAHTVAYVPREALSGAAIVALGCDEIVMGLNAFLGDAGPVFMGEDFQFRHAPEKIRSDLVAKIGKLAELHGRPPALAKAMVDMDLVVYQVRNTTTGAITFMADREIASSDHPEDWEKIKPVAESSKGQFLEVTGQRAVELGLAEANISGREELIERYGLKDPLTILKPTAVDSTVYILNLPVVTGLLFIVGLIALYIEFSAPGIGLGGLTAVLCFALFFWSRYLGGTADWLEIVLFAAGLMFLGVELFVLPGFGISGLSGILLLLASLVMASQEFIIPETPRQLATTTTTLLVLAVSGVVCALAMMYLSARLGTLPVFKRLVLKPPAAGEQSQQPDQRMAASRRGPVEKAELRVGDRGVAQSALRPAGKARFGKRYVNVVTDSEFINKKRRVEIVEIARNRVVVREIQES